MISFSSRLDVNWDEREKNSPNRFPKPQQTKRALIKTGTQHNQFPSNPSESAIDPLSVLSDIDRRRLAVGQNVRQQFRPIAVLEITNA